MREQTRKTLALSFSTMLVATAMLPLVLMLISAPPVAAQSGGYAQLDGFENGWVSSENDSENVLSTELATDWTTGGTYSGKLVRESKYFLLDGCESGWSAGTANADWYTEGTASWMVQAGPSSTTTATKNFDLTNIERLEIDVHTSLAKSLSGSNWGRARIYVGSTVVWEYTPPPAGWEGKEHLNQVIDVSSYTGVQTIKLEVTNTYNVDTMTARFDDLRQSPRTPANNYVKIAKTLTFPSYGTPGIKFDARIDSNLTLPGAKIELIVGGTTLWSKTLTSGTSTFLNETVTGVNLSGELLTEWKLTAENDLPHDLNSSAWIDTLKIYEFFRPNSPLMPYCENQTNPTNIAAFTPRFSAIFTDNDPNDNALYAQVQVGMSAGDNSLWDSGWISITAIDNNTRCEDITYAGSTLNYQVTYHWRIRFKDNYGIEGEWSEDQNFKINAPPESSVTVISPYWQTSVPFVVSATASDPNNDEIENVTLWYNWSSDNSVWQTWTEFGTDNDNSDGWSWFFTAPKGDNFYKFYTIGADNVGSTEAAPADADRWCGVDREAPSEPALVSPADDENLNDNTPLLDWEPVSDLSGVTYSLQIDDDPDFGSPEVDLTGLTVDSYAPAGLADGTWYWRVRVVDGAMHSSGWSSRPFTVITLLWAPEPFSPANGSATTDNTPTLSWSVSPTVENYVLQYSTSGNFDTYTENILNAATQFTLPELAENRYYWRAKATTTAENVENSAWSITRNFWVDRTNPSISSFLINDGASETTSSNVVFSISASDMGSGVYQMCFKNEGGSWGPWEAYSTSKTWALTSGDGTKTVYAKVRDRALNESNILNDSITKITEEKGAEEPAPLPADTTPPALTVLEPTTTEVDENITVRVSASDSSGIDSSSIQVNLDEGAVDYTWADGVVKCSFVGLSVGAHLIVVKVSDASSNHNQATVNVSFTVIAPVENVENINVENIEDVTSTPTFTFLLSATHPEIENGYTQITLWITNPTPQPILKHCELHFNGHVNPFDIEVAAGENMLVTVWIDVTGMEGTYDMKLYDADTNMRLDEGEITLLSAAEQPEVLPIAVTPEPPGLPIVAIGIVGVVVGLSVLRIVRKLPKINMPKSGFKLLRAKITRPSIRLPSLPRLPKIRGKPKLEKMPGPEEEGFKEISERVEGEIEPTEAPEELELVEESPVVQDIYRLLEPAARELATKKKVGHLGRAVKPYKKRRC